MCHATEQQTIQAGTPCIIVCIHGITRYLSPLLHGQRALGTCGTARLTCGTSRSPAQEVLLSCASEGQPDDLVLYSGILLQHKERHTELHVSKAIVPRLYFPVTAVHHKPIDLPKCAYPNWPSLHTQKMSSQNTSPFPFFLAQILLYSRSKLFSIEEFRDSTLHKRWRVFFHSINYKDSEVPATALLLQQLFLLSLVRAPA